MRQAPITQPIPGPHNRFGAGRGDFLSHSDDGQTLSIDLLEEAVADRSFEAVMAGIEQHPAGQHVYSNSLGYTWQRELEATQATREVDPQPSDGLIGSLRRKGGTHYEASIWTLGQSVVDTGSRYVDERRHLANEFIRRALRRHS